MNRLTPFARPLLALVVLAAAPALGQGRGDRKVVITDTLDGNSKPTKCAPQGGVVILKGRNFHQCPEDKKDENGKTIKAPPCAHAELNVKVASANAVVLASTFDFLTIIIPQATSPGKKVKIDVRVDDRGSASTDIEVMSVADYAEFAKKEGAAAEGGSGGQQDRLEQEALESVKIHKFAQVPTSAGNTFVVEGVAKGIPDRATIQVDLKFDGRPIPEGSRTIAVKDEAFSTTFGPFRQRLLYGNYSLELLFELSNQSKRLRRQWEPMLADAQRQIYGRLQRREISEYGTGAGGKVSKEDREKQTAELKAHYKLFCAKILQLRDEVRTSVADAGRSFFREGREVNESNYKNWLKQMGFAETDAEAIEILEKRKYGKSSGHFEAAKFEAWAKSTLLPALTQLYNDHKAFEDQYICSMDDSADTLANWLVAIVLNRLQEWSQKLYEHSNLPLPDAIGRVPVSPVEPPQMSRKFFDAKRRELLRRVGLESEIEASK